MKRLFALVAVMLVLCASATQYSKLSIITSAKALGKWDALKGWIYMAQLQDEWDACAYLSDTYPAYATITNSIVSSGAVSNDELVFIISNSVDTAVQDSCFRRVYDNEMKSSSGRIKWHGPVQSTVVDTNALVKTVVYQDGYVYTEEFHPVTPADSNKRLTPVKIGKDGVPVAMKRARERREREINGGVSNVTVEVIGNLPK